ncbi:hypothetical protein QJQ45_000602 [Haematococcus lacustris]|nr:hypothetical protein QJQ45_000602 [Haematococcus lacustris]
MYVIAIIVISNCRNFKLSIVDADLQPPALALEEEQEEAVEEPLPADLDLEQVPGGNEMDVEAAERKLLSMLMHDQMLGAFDLKCMPGQDGARWSKRPQGHFKYDPSLPGADQARLAKLMTDLQAKQVAHHVSDAHTTAILELLASTSTVPNIPASASAMRTAMEELGQPQEEYLVYDMCPCGHIYRGPLAQHADSCRYCSKPRTSALEARQYRPVRQWLQRMYAYPALAEQLTLWRDLRAEYTRDSHTMSDAWHSPAFERVLERHGDGTVPMSLSFDSFQPHKDDAKYYTTAFVLAPLTAAAEHRSVPGVSHLACLMPGAKERGEKQSILDALLLIVEDLLSLDGAVEVHNSYLEESRRVKPILACIRGDYRGLALAMGSNQKQSPARFFAEHDQWLKEELCGVKLPVPDTNGIQKRHPKECLVVSSPTPPHPTPPHPTPPHPTHMLPAVPERRGWEGAYRLGSDPGVHGDMHGDSGSDGEGGSLDPELDEGDDQRPVGWECEEGDDESEGDASFDAVGDQIDDSAQPLIDDLSDGLEDWSCLFLQLPHFDFYDAVQYDPMHVLGGIVKDTVLGVLLGLRWVPAVTRIESELKRYEGYRLGRLMDPAKKRKVHTMLQFAGPIGLYALASAKALLRPTVYATLMLLLQVINIMWCKEVHKDSLPRLQRLLAIAVCMVERYLPVSELDVKLHELMMLMENVRRWGPPFVLTMFPVESMFGQMQRDPKNQLLHAPKPHRRSRLQVALPSKGEGASVANGASVVQCVKPLFLSKGKAQEFNQPTSDGEAVLSAVVKDVLEAVDGMVAASRQRHAAEYGGKLDSIFLPANGAKPHLDATARALFLQWIKTKAENAIKQSKSPSSKDAEQATPVKAITGKDGRAFAAPAAPSGDEVQGEMAAGNMGKLHWSFGAAWNSFGATQQQPVMGNSQLVDGSLDQLSEGPVCVPNQGVETVSRTCVYAKAARAQLGWSGEEAQLFIKMACGYGINAKSSELKAATLDKGHVADLIEEANKHRRLLGMKKQGSLQDTLSLPCRMQHAVHVCRWLEQWQQPHTPPAPGQPKRGKRRGVGPRTLTCPPPFTLTPMARVGVHVIKVDSRVLHGVCKQLGLTKETRVAFTSEPALSHHWARWFDTKKLRNKEFAFERTVDTDGVSVCVHYTRPLPPPPAPPPAASSSSSSSSSPSAAAAAAHAVGLPHIGKGIGTASIGTAGGWGADAVLRACCKVVCRPRGAGQRRGRVVLVDEHRTSRVSSAVNGKQPCEEELDKFSAARPAGWKPPAGQVEPRLVRPAWSQERDQPVRGLMWCPVVAPRKPPQAPRSSQAATQPAASEPGPSTPPPAKRSKPASEPTQPTKGKGKGKAAKAKPAPQPGRWLDRDCNAALNMQRIGESKWRPLELCYWPDQGALPAKGKEYPGLGYKRLRDQPPKVQQQQQQQPAEAQ